MDIYDLESLLIRRRPIIDLGGSDASLRALVAHGKIVSVAPGTYVDSAKWAALSPRMKHVVRVLAARHRLHPETIYARESAAALWGVRLAEGVAEPCANRTG